MEVKKSELCLMACIAIKNCLFSVTDMDENNSTVAFTDEFTGVHGKVVINNDDSFSIILREILDESPSKEDMGFFEECMTLEDQCIEFHPDMTLTYHEVNSQAKKDHKVKSHITNDMILKVATTLIYKRRFQYET